MSDIPEGFKRCSKCGELKPGTNEFFSKHKLGKNGLRPHCKACQHDYGQTYYHTDEYRQKQRDYRKTEKYQQWQHDFVRTDEYRQKQRDRNQQESRRERDRQRNKTPERKAWRRRRYIVSETIRIRAIERAKALYDRDKGKPIYRLKANIIQQRRRARMGNLPVDWNKNDAERMMDYWQYKCAICGRAAGFWHYLAHDHWIPIASDEINNPGTVPWNILPLCHARKGSNGMSGCNQTKAKKNPVQWLIEHLGEKQANKKLHEIEAYFEWVRLQRGQVKE